jgi:4-amino-4-deoxy-L-arabinose transferase-like glycosyltransferase
MMNWVSRRLHRKNIERTIFVAILLVAGVFRFYRIDQVPPGLHFDEAFNLFDILRLLEGQFAIFFPANFGRESLYFYLSMVGTAIFGAHALALRLTSAIIGTVTVGLAYGFARAVFRSSLMGALTAFLMAISVWHIYYSRLGLRVILCVPLAMLMLWFFWRALSLASATDDGRREWIFAGICVALAVYTYTAGRLLPVILISLTIVAILTDRARWRSYVRGLFITGIVAFTVFVPLGVYFIMNPRDFVEHGSNLSIWDPRVNRGDLFGTMYENLIAVLGMFVALGDKEAFRNVPDNPVFDPIIGVFFVIGCLVMIRALVSSRSSIDDRRRAAFLVVSSIVLIAPSILSDAPPNFTRTLPATSTLMMIPAWGIAIVWHRFRHHAMPLAVGAILLASVTLSFKTYFFDFANSPALYYAFDVRMFDVAGWINRNAHANQIYLAPLWYQQGTLALLTRTTPLKSFESRDTIVLPRASGKDALYAFPMEQERKATTLGQRLGALATREIVSGSTGESILIVYRVPAQNLPNPQSPISTLARGSEFLQPQKIAREKFGDAIELLGYSVNAADAAKRNLEVTLFIHALAPMTEEYTFSLKVRDAKDRVWGQEDKWAGNNSYATMAWTPGDVIVEKFYPGLNACAPAGDYRITVEAYNPQTSAVLGLIDLGATRADAAPGNLYEHLEPAQQIDVQVAPQARLLGYTLTPGDVKVGDEFSLALFWRGVGDGKQTGNAIVKLRDAAGRDFTLVEKTITLPIESRGLCTFFDLQMPPNTAPGQGSIFVNDAKLSTLKVVR